MSTEFLRGLSLETPEFSELLPLLKNWDLLEIPGDALDSADFLHKIRKYPVRLLIRDLCAAELARRLPESSLSVRREFSRMFRERCARAAELGAAEISIAFDFARAVEFPEYGACLRFFLRSCCGVLEEFHLTLSIPLRIPGAAPQKFLQFLHQALYPGFHLLPDFHPHEPGAFEQLPGAAKKLRFERSLWRITYEPSLGNYLAPELIRRFFTALSLEKNETVGVLFAPGKSRMERSLIESLEQLGKI